MPRSSKLGKTELSILEYATRRSKPFTQLTLLADMRLYGPDAFNALTALLMRGLIRTGDAGPFEFQITPEGRAAIEKLNAQPERENPR